MNLARLPREYWCGLNEVLRRRSVNQHASDEVIGTTDSSGVTYQVAEGRSPHLYQ